MAYDFVDVYAVVNDIAKQAVGGKAINVTDTASFVDLGNNILSSNDAVESFMDTLLLRVAKTYYTTRAYRAKLQDLLVSGSQWAAIYQKIDTSVGDFIEDESLKLEDGKSVDMYIVRKPSATQKLFVKKSDYQNFITTHKKTLQGAFTSEAAFQAFASDIATKMRTKLDFATENMARLAIGNFIGLMNDAQKVHLLTRYNVLTDGSLTADEALLNKDFLAWAAGVIELESKRMSDLSVLNNKEGVERHTPSDDMFLLVFDEFQTAMQYCLQYQAFHDNLVRMRSFVEVSYWQAEKSRDRINLTVQDGDNTKEVTVTNIMAFAFDRYALGCFRSNERVNTTPWNARGEYANTFYTAMQLWYNDLSENAKLFLLD